MTELVPCADCARHVKVDAASCPFCGCALRLVPRRRPRIKGATRAAMFYLGASLAGCSGGAPAAPQEEPVHPEPAANIYGGPPLPVDEPVSDDPGGGADIYGGPPIADDEATDSPTEPAEEER